MDPERPWLRFYGGVPHTLQYPDATLYEALAATAARVPDSVAFDFFGTEVRYRELVALVDRCSAGLAALGIEAGDPLLVAMPTAPQGVIAFYAANRLGAVAAMIHPLSPPAEIAHYLHSSGARVALTLDAFADRFAALPVEAAPRKLVLASIAEYMPAITRAGFWLTKGRHIPPIKRGSHVIPWLEMMQSPHPLPPKAGSADSLGAILFSGGTTALPKGVALSNRNVIAEGMQAAAWVGMGGGDSILAILPIFHGFGLGVCVNAAFMGGGKSILVPTFTPDTVAKLIRSKRPNLIVGVPTLFDSLSRNAALARTDLSCIKAAFCGADTLPRPVKERFEALVAARGGSARLLEGYGLTEAVTGIMATPLGEYREGSIGVPFPDMLAKICEVGGTRELPHGEEGEICVSGPAVMQGYLDDAEATAQALRRHADGRTWLHTGDLGRRDADGFFYFTCRLKRLIKSSGFNVHPAQVEEVLYAHPAVQEACVIGVPDPHQVERVKAFVVPKPPAVAGKDLESELIEHCRTHLLKWSCPREVEFREKLPVTRIGKIDFRALAQEEAANARR